MAKIPLHNLFEQAFELGKINNREDFDKLIAELEAEDEAETKREEDEKKSYKIPNGLKKCQKCGEYKGKVRERDLPPTPTVHTFPPRGYETKDGKGYIEVWCLCQGILCRKCKKNMVHRPISNFYDPTDGRVYHTPAMSDCLCNKCSELAKWGKMR